MYLMQGATGNSGPPGRVGIQGEMVIIIVLEDQSFTDLQADRGRCIPSTNPLYMIESFVIQSFTGLVE